MRKWEIIIYNKTEEDKFEVALNVSKLRCVFKTTADVLASITICTIEIYNLNMKTEGNIIRDGLHVSIFGGYQDAQYGEIFTGEIVQVIRNRENGIDYKLEIIALRGSGVLDTNHIRCAVASGSTPRDLIETISSKADKSIVLGAISDNLPQQQLPRGKVLFGAAGKYFRDISINNNAYYWVDEENKLTLKKTADEIPSDRVLLLTPQTGLIGTPQYTDDGIQIKMLLEPRAKIFGMIAIDNEIIRRQLLNIDVSGKGNGNQLPQQNQFDKDGEYQIKSLSHCGDTYGDDWYTEVIGVSRTGRIGLTAGEENEMQTQR